MHFGICGPQRIYLQPSDSGDEGCIRRAAFEGVFENRKALWCRMFNVVQLSQDEQTDAVSQDPAYTVCKACVLMVDRESRNRALLKMRRSSLDRCPAA